MGYCAPVSGDSPAEIPAPLEWHPAYRDRTWLIDWLEGKTAEYPADRILLPILPVLRLFERGLDPTYPQSAGTLVLTKRKAWGWAPYVGRPFVYVWYVATDDLGRSIAGESRIVYTD